MYSHLYWLSLSKSNYFAFFFTNFSYDPNPLKCFHHQRSFKLRTNRKSYLLSLIVSMTSSYHRSSGVTCIVSGAWEFHGMCRKPDALPPSMYRCTHVTHALSTRHLFENIRGCIHPLAKDTRDFFVFALLHFTFHPLPITPNKFVIALIVCDKRFELGINKKYPEAILSVIWIPIQKNIVWKRWISKLKLKATNWTI